MSIYCYVFVGFFYISDGGDSGGSGYRTFRSGFSVLTRPSSTDRLLQGCSEPRPQQAIDHKVGCGIDSKGQRRELLVVEVVMSTSRLSIQ